MFLKIEAQFDNVSYILEMQYGACFKWDAGEMLSRVA